MRPLYTSNLLQALNLISHGLDAEAADSLTPDSGRLLLRCGGFDRWRSRREAEAVKDGPDGLRRMDGREDAFPTNGKWVFHPGPDPESCVDSPEGRIVRNLT